MWRGRDGKGIIGDRQREEKVEQIADALHNRLMTGKLLVEV